MNFYNQNYDPSEEDDEFIVRLPQIIAGGLYEGKIVELLEPLVEYWQEKLSLQLQQRTKNNMILVKFV